ncbi:hypothetical protein Poly51_12990 [Rubripirellula tenax]|uniref:Uncharacterized protein n=2 Tax=Rubripirellula tenax TaxID=2528015 RepID=A0A5C6FD62_9BACT|nr:hypothetical protein Poly51_12990 [Rubripirellula tenax]
MGGDLAHLFRFSCTDKMISPQPLDPIRSRVAQAATTLPEQRVLAGLEHSELAIRVVEDGIRDQNPLADDATITRLLAERIELMRRIQDRTLAKK